LQKNPNTIPVGAYPESEITFPAKSPGQEPIKRKYTLKERCSGNCLEGWVQAPESAGKGIAKVVLSFDAWKPGAVQPATLDVPVHIIEAVELVQLVATHIGHEEFVWQVVWRTAKRWQACRKPRKRSNSGT